MPLQEGVSSGHPSKKESPRQLSNALKARRAAVALTLPPRRTAYVCRRQAPLPHQPFATATSLSECCAAHATRGGKTYLVPCVEVAVVVGAGKALVVAGDHEAGLLGVGLRGDGTTKDRPTDACMPHSRRSQPHAEPLPRSREKNVYTEVHTCLLQRKPGRRGRQHKRHVPPLPAAGGKKKNISTLALHIFNEQIARACGARAHTQTHA